MREQHERDDEESQAVPNHREQQCAANDPECHQSGRYGQRHKRQYRELSEEARGTRSPLNIVAVPAHGPLGSGPVRRCPAVSIAASEEDVRDYSRAVPAPFVGSPTISTGISAAATSRSGTPRSSSRPARPVR